MSEYRVTWVIDIDAESPLEAAQHALEIQRNPESTAQVFQVHNNDPDSDEDTIDLLDPETYP